MAKTGPIAQNVERYEQWFLDHRFAYVSELKAVQALLPKSGAGVEVGVGTGRFAAPLKIGQGVEPAAAMAALARKRGVEVTAGTAGKLPFEDGRFDYALMVATLCLVDDPAAALREAHRVLKPAGALVVGLVDRVSPLGRSYLEGKEKSLFCREAGCFSTAEVVALIEQAGFHDFAFAQTLFRPLDRVEEVEAVRSGHGEGAFVAVRGHK